MKIIIERCITPARNKRYRSTEKEIKENIRLNQLQKERDEKAQKEALEKQRLKS